MITVFYTQGIYIVTEVLHSFGDTKITKWYYDMNKLLISEKMNFPDNELTRKLSDVEIEWFNKYYKHKAKTI